MILFMFCSSVRDPDNMMASRRGIKPGDNGPAFVGVFAPIARKWSVGCTTTAHGVGAICNKLPQSPAITTVTAVVQEMLGNH